MRNIEFSGSCGFSTSENLRGRGMLCASENLAYDPSSCMSHIFPPVVNGTVSTLPGSCLHSVLDGELGQTTGQLTASGPTVQRRPCLMHKGDRRGGPVHPYYTGDTPTLEQLPCVPWKGQVSSKTSREVGPWKPPTAFLLPEVQMTHHRDGGWTPEWDRSPPALSAQFHPVNYCLIFIPLQWAVSDGYCNSEQ